MPFLSPDELMSLALDEARLAFAEREVPIGAVVAFEDGSIVTGRNGKVKSGFLYHAEIMALGLAYEEKGREALEKAVVYVTLEPCLMCLGAMIEARVSGLVYGADEPKFGGISLLERAWKEGRYPHRFPVHGGLMGDESAALLREFFRGVRSKGV